MSAMTIKDKQQRLHEAGWGKSGPGWWVDPVSHRAMLFQTAWATYRTHLQLKEDL